MRRLLWRLEAAGFAALLVLFRALGPVRASDLAGAIARAVGPRLPVSRVAGVNLRLAFPDRDAAFRRAAIRAMWDSLGRVAGELPHLPAILARRDAAEGPGWRAEGLENLPEVGRPAIFVSGHFGNFELLPGAAARLDRGFALVYRAIGNPIIDRRIFALRRAALGAAAPPLLPKGAAGARGALATLRAGGRLALLADQKMNDGIAAPLFGRPAMTAPAAAQMALRFGCPIVPALCLREGPARFRVIIEKPLALPATGDRQADIAALTEAINARIEAWARAHPGQWLWAHRRFDKALYR